MNQQDTEQKWHSISTEPLTGELVAYLSPTAGVWIGNRPDVRVGRGKWRQAPDKSWHGSVLFGRAKNDETHWQPIPDSLKNLPEEYNTPPPASDPA